MTIVSSASFLHTRSLPPKEFEAINADVCACGLQKGENVQISLINSAGNILWNSEQVAQQAWKGKVGSEPLPQTYCVEIHDISKFDFIPTDHLGTYFAEITGAKSKLIYSFEVRNVEEPIVYFSQRLNAHVVVGFGPNENLRVLEYKREYDDPSKKFGTYTQRFVREIEIQVDKFGIGLIIGTLADSDITVLRGDIKTEYFEILGNKDTINWQAILEANPANAHAQYHYARHITGNKFEAYSKVIVLDPNYMMAYYERGVELGEYPFPDTEKYLSAVSDFSRAIALNPKFVRAYEARADIYMRLGEYESAISDTEKIIELAPNHPGGYFYRGYAYKQLKMYEQAIADFSKAIDIDLHYTLGHRWRGQFDFEITNSFQELGLIYETLDRRQLAVENFRRFLEVSPSYARDYPIDDMPMLFVSAGSFLMGTLSTDFGTDATEQPQHEVYLESFWIDQYEVTQAQYKFYIQCKANGVCPEKTIALYRDKPVTNVTWRDARDYCAWTGRRLPTEAEWEKVARGDDARLYPWGNEQPDSSKANYNGEGIIDVDALLFEPDGYQISPYGAINMSGNVWEWINDYYAADYYSTSPDTNPQGPKTGSDRVLRGGSWGTKNPIFLRVTNRWSQPEDYSSEYVGFRCALDASKN